MYIFYLFNEIYLSRSHAKLINSAKQKVEKNNEAVLALFFKIPSKI